MTILGDGAVAAARYRNALIGLAAGDAWGYQVEFTKYAHLRVRPVPAPAGEWVISDDTQMTLAVDEALSQCPDLGDIDAVTDALTSNFIAWQRDPDNNRAPGNACMEAVSNLRGGARWHERGGATDSAGCGAVMRLTPTAFSSSEQWLGLTALQAVITHRHPMAVAAALLLADATRHAPARHGRFLEQALATAADIEAGRCVWSEDPCLVEVLAPVTDDVAGYLAGGVAYMLHDCLRSAAAKRARLLRLTLKSSATRAPTWARGGNRRARWPWPCWSRISRPASTQTWTLPSAGRRPSRGRRPATATRTRSPAWPAR